RIDPDERPGRVRSRQRDPRGVLVRHVEETICEPRRDVLERLLVRVQDALALQPLVEVEDVDVLRATLVGRSGDGSGEVLLADVARHGDELARLDIGTEDRQLRELRGPVVDLAHRRTLTTREWAGCA